MISAGFYTSFGITDTGILYSWGNAYGGKLGDGTTINKSSPVTVVGGITNWSAISAGDNHNLGLTDTGVLYVWGSNSFFGTPTGQLGDGTTIDRSSPVTVVGGITNWSAISAGFQHSLGLTDTGVIYAWGFGLTGRLGDGTTIDRSSPVTVVGGITNWSTISAGNIHNLALKTRQE
jgi:alpha-tubulin suppressor-like RCC1 family protein